MNNLKIYFQFSICPFLQCSKISPLKNQLYNFIPKSYCLFYSAQRAWKSILLCVPRIWGRYWYIDQSAAFDTIDHSCSLLSHFISVLAWFTCGWNPGCTSWRTSLSSPAFDLWGSFRGQYCDYVLHKAFGFSHTPFPFSPDDTQVNISDSPPMRCTPFWMEILVVLDGCKQSKT